MQPKNNEESISRFFKKKEPMIDFLVEKSPMDAEGTINEQPPQKPLDTQEMDVGADSHKVKPSNQNTIQSPYKSNRAADIQGDAKEYRKKVIGGYEFNIISDSDEGPPSMESSDGYANFCKQITPEWNPAA